PVVAFQLPVMPFWLVKARTSSPVTKLPLIETVALDRLVLSASVTVRPASTTFALSPSVNASAAAVIVTTGGLLLAATVMLRVAVFEFAVPSFATTEMVRADVEGLLLV